MSQDKSLADRIADLYRKGKIPRRFRVRDVWSHLQNEFAENYPSRRGDGSTPAASTTFSLLESTS